MNAAARPHDVDVAALNRHLARVAPELGTVESARQFEGGQSNPTFLLTASGGRYVLRRKPVGALLPSAHAVDREFRVIGALRDSAVPVPKTLFYCSDDAVIGTAFYVMEFVDGLVLRQPQLPGLQPQQRAQVYAEMVRVLAALHAIEPAAVGLADFGRPGNYVARQIDRWTRQYRATQDATIEAMERLIEWLPRHVPPEEPARITHGDFRVDNVIFDREAARILAVIDWELATLGDPVADFAYSCVPWRTPEKLAGLGPTGLATPGIPTEAEYVAQYCRLTGRTGLPHLDFYVAFNLFRRAAILQGVAARAVQGNASSAKALETGRLARPVAEAGWAQAQRSNHL
jgi:aminoglycoside phosphotransferase (APT) family kinase protein